MTLSVVLFDYSVSTEAVISIKLWQSSYCKWPYCDYSDYYSTQGEECNTFMECIYGIRMRLESRSVSAIKMQWYTWHSMKWTGSWMTSCIRHGHICLGLLIHAPCYLALLHLLPKIPMQSLTAMFEKKSVETEHLGMFPISSVQVILHKLLCETILCLGDILFWWVNYYLQRA